MSIGVLVGAESTAGTAAATLVSLPADFTAKLNKANTTVEEVRSGQDIHFTTRPGVEFEEWSIVDSAIYYDTFGVILAAAMGAPTVTAAGVTGFSNAFKFADSPKTLTFHTTQPRRATEPYKLTNAVVDKLTISFDAEGNLTYNSAGFAKTRTTASVSAPTFAFSSVAPFVAWKGQVAFNSAALGSYAKLKKGSISITRNRKPMFTVNNVATANQYATGARMVEFDLTCDFVTVGEFDKFRNGTTDSLTIKWSHPTDTFGSSPVSQVLQVKLGTVYIEDAQIDTSADLPEVSLKGKALYNSSDASLAVVTLECITSFTTVPSGAAGS